MPTSVAYTSVSRQVATSANTGDVQSITVPVGTAAMTLSAVGQSMIISEDGTDPTTTSGHWIIVSAQPVTIPWVPKGGTLKTISSTASTGRLMVSLLNRI